MTTPSLMISLDGRPRELTGRVIGGTLAWGRQLPHRPDNDNTHTTHLFAGINEEQSHTRNPARSSRPRYSPSR